jgi:general secretion pathway protein G
VVSADSWIGAAARRPETAGYPTVTRGHNRPSISIDDEEDVSVRQGQRQSKQRRGFTLLEVLLVVAILVALAAIVIPNYLGVQQGAMIDSAEIQVRELDGAVKLYQIHTQQFPANEQGLQALMIQPDQTLTNWRGPYLTSIPKDPWGMPYNYQYPGQRNLAGGPDIWSNGPNRQGGDQDDIGNWAATP